MENKSDNFNKKFLFLCVGLITTMIYCFCITFLNVPVKNENIAYLILGVLLGSCIKDAYSYLFGSTDSSRQKDQMIKDALASTPASTPPQTINNNAPVAEQNITPQTPVV